jgi:hypothetical protein
VWQSTTSTCVRRNLDNQLADMQVDAISRPVMLLFTIPLGGLLFMMGNQSRSESLFYYFRLEDQVPENHLLRLIDRHLRFEFIRAKLKDSYSDAGRHRSTQNCCWACCWFAISTGNQRKETGGRAAHASGVALVHRTGLRSGDSALLHVLQEPGTIP